MTAAGRAGLQLAAMCIAGLSLSACTDDASTPRAARSGSTSTSTSAPTAAASTTMSASTTTTTATTTSTSTTRPTTPSTSPPATTSNPLPRPTDATCNHRPMFVKYASYYGIPDPVGTSLDALAGHRDVDGKSGANQIKTDGTFAVDIVRPDGLVAFVHPGGVVSTTGYNDLGDLAGDGRVEFAVSVQTGATSFSWYVIPTDIALGTHDPVDVGVRISAFAGGPPIPVGDQDGDGADDFALRRRLIYSGRALMRARGLPRPLRKLDGKFAGLLQLQAGAPTFVEIGGTERDPELVVDVAPKIRLLPKAGRVGLPYPTSLYENSVKGWLVNGHRIVQLEYSSRSGGSVWRWDLDAPCLSKSGAH